MEMVHFIPPSQRRMALLAAQADEAPVLIYGASGTGKGAIARWIHANSPRAAKTILTAKHDRPLIEQIRAAQGGSLIIPSMGEWPLGEQKALLDYLTTKTVPLPAGENPDAGLRMLLNTRIIVTTSQALEGRAQGGLFNIELLQKLNVFRLEMPALTQRAGEFEDIVLGLLGEITRELHKAHLKSFSPEAWAVLRDYEWPGNLRELRNVLKIAVIAANGDAIEFADLPEFGHDRVDFRATREEFEKVYILELLKTFNWEIDRTCTITKMDKGILLAKLKKYGIEPQASLN